MARLIIISAPSGAGKTSLIKSLVESCEQFRVSVSHTTRKARDGERHGDHYYFIDEDAFRWHIEQDHFIEYAKVFGYYYGTSYQQLEEKLASKKDIILEIDWQGAEQIRAKAKCEVVTIFILPPDYNTLRERLLKRQDEDIEVINNRVSLAKQEIVQYKNYDYVIINGDFGLSLSVLEHLLTVKGEHRQHRSAYYTEFVERLVGSQN